MLAAERAGAGRQRLLGRDVHAATRTSRTSSPQHERVRRSQRRTRGPSARRSILTELWARRLAGTGVVVHAMHPGWADTPGVVTSLPRFHRLAGPLLRSPEEGADTIVWLGAADEPGQQLRRLLARPPPAPDAPRAVDEGERPRTASGSWRECEHLTGWHAVPAPNPTHMHA